MTATYTNKLQSLRKELKKAFLERDLIIDGLLASLLAGQNAVLFGPPGTAKSALISAICEAIDGAKFFNRLLQKAAPPEDLLGQPSLKALEKEDILRRNTQNRLPEAHIAFLDEIFKCNPTTLNSLLRLINERVFENPEPAPVPLLFLCGASNEIPSEPELQAFFDRFTYRPFVGYTRRKPSRRKLIERAASRKTPAITTRLSLIEVQAMAIECEQIGFSNNMVETLLNVQAALEKEGFTISDRKLQKLVQLLQAYAYVTGETEVSCEQLHDLFPDCLWVRKEDERREIKKIMNQVAPALNQQLLSLYDAAKSESALVVEAALEYDSQPYELQENKLIDAIERATKNLGNIKNKLQQSIDESSNGTREKAKGTLVAIEDMLVEIAGYRDRVL